MHAPTNEQIAAVLDGLAERLARQGETNHYRIRAYRAAAETVRAQDAPLAERYTESGLDPFLALPGVGHSIALHIARYIETGRLGGRLPADALDPVSLFAALPGLSRPLARRVVEALGIETLAELERACYDGSLRAVPGIGRTRERALRMQLNTLLQWAALERYQRPRPRPRPAAPLRRVVPEPSADDFRLAA
jgi:putative hydrolase